MEDITLSQRLRAIGRHWERHGVWRTIFRMWRPRAAFHFGADPAPLALRYGYRSRQH